MEISASFVVENAIVIAPLLTNYFNAIIKSGCLPSRWNDAYLVPIPKKGNIADVGNYRGISIQSTIPKILDKLMTEKLLPHIHPILPEQQHGFIAKKGTTTNLLEASQFIKQNIQDGESVDAIYVDLSKAFDRLNHEILARKLAGLGVPYGLR